MNRGVDYWRALYLQRKHNAVALDVETEAYDGEISVISLYRRKTSKRGELVQIIKGHDSIAESLREELSGCSLIITFNGCGFDIPKMMHEFNGSIPPAIPVLDLYLLAKAIGFYGGLKVMEHVFGISRPDKAGEAKGRTHYLWRQFKEGNNAEALDQLLEYAASDVRNLFALADTLMEWAKAKRALPGTGLDRFDQLPDPPLRQML